MARADVCHGGIVAELHSLVHYGRAVASIPIQSQLLNCSAMTGSEDGDRRVLEYRSDNRKWNLVLCYSAAMKFTEGLTQ